MSEKTKILARAVAEDKSEKELEVIEKEALEARYNRLVASFPKIHRHKTLGRFLPASEMSNVSFLPPQVVYLEPVDLDKQHGLTIQQIIDKQIFESGNYANEEAEYEYNGEETEDYLEPSTLDSPYAKDPAELSDIERHVQATADTVVSSIAKAEASKRQQVIQQSTELSPNSSEKPDTDK